jgi:hypothetical protein
VIRGLETFITERDFAAKDSSAIVIRGQTCTDQGVCKTFITERDFGAKDFYPLVAKPVLNLPGFGNLASF